MRIHELKDKNVVIWGTGREGQAAAELIHAKYPDKIITLVDEVEPGSLSSLGEERVRVRWGSTEIKETLDTADVIVKSPGVSLYHPLIQQALAQKKTVTSLLNLWMAQPHTATIIGITGTKGKSTTSSLLTHTLNTLGKKAVLVGNIGIPVTQAPNDADVIVIEISSYQAATFSGTFPISILTSLYPEHLDWHRSLETYYRDKLNLLKHSQLKTVNAQTLDILRQNKLPLEHTLVFNQPNGMHITKNKFYDHEHPLGTLNNSYLMRPSNQSNVCAALAAIKKLGIDPKQALAAMKDFKGLPHRQQELGIRDGILYVDDSIATTPQSAIAAMEFYQGKPVTLIAGGHDRGIDYTPLVDDITTKKLNAVICMGPCGQRIYDALWKKNYKKCFCANSMREAVALAQKQTPKEGVILLSPAAPSYGLFKNFEERGDAFAKESGF